MLETFIELNKNETSGIIMSNNVNTADVLVILFQLTFYVIGT